MNLIIQLSAVHVVFSHNFANRVESLVAFSVYGNYGRRCEQESNFYISSIIQVVTFVTLQNIVHGGFQQLLIPLTPNDP